MHRSPVAERELDIFRGKYPTSDTTLGPVIESRTYEKKVLIEKF